MIENRKTLSVLDMTNKADLVDGKVPAEQLPSYVDDVVEYEDFEHFPAEGELSKIYVDLSTNYTYRWSGSTYVQVGGSNTSYFPIPEGWTLNGTTAELCADIVADEVVTAGMVYCGKLNCSDLPVNLTQAEAVIEIITDEEDSGKSIHIILTSADHAPYHWEYNYVKTNGVYGSPAGWVGYQPQLESGVNIKTVAGKGLLGSGNVELVKGDVGLGNVDNTSDADKPISTATQAALDLKLNAADYVVDSELSSSSTNPVQNKVVKSALDEKVDVDDTTDIEVSDEQVTGAPILGSITIDNDPYNIPAKTSELQNDAGFITDAYHDDTKLNVADYIVDDAISASSENPVQNKVVKSALDEKVDVDDTTNFEVSEDQVADAPIIGSITIDTDAYNLPAKTSDLQNDAGFITDAYHDSTKLNVSDYIVDAAISISSENPVQNKVVKAALDEKVDAADTTNFETSENQVNDAPFLGSITIDTDAYNIPKKVGDLQNDAGFMTAADLDGKIIPTYTAADAGKVVKVNSTGDGVELADDFAGAEVCYLQMSIGSIKTVPADLLAKINAAPEKVIISNEASRPNQYHGESLFLYVGAGVVGGGWGLTYVYASTSVSGTQVFSRTYQISMYGQYQTYDSTYNASNKQDTLVSGSNIKTINNASILGSGNVSVVGQSVVADEYDATATYEEGDYCMHDNALYQCISAITTAEAWDSTHWDVVQIVDKLSSGGVLLTEITYADLKAAVLAGTLIPGMQYRITDYVTMTTASSGQTVPKYISSRGKQFDLIVRAIDNSTLDHHASACIHPGETYFIASDRLDLWQIWYDLVPAADDYKYTWYDYTNGKGCIYRMIDQLGNDLPCDFKNILISDRPYLSWYQNGAWNDKTSGSVAAALNNKFYVGYVYNNPNRRLYLPNTTIQADMYATVVSNNVVCCSVNAQSATLQTVVIQHLNFTNNFINLGYNNNDLVITKSTYNKIFLGSNITKDRITNNADANIFVDKIVSGSLQINDDLVAPAKYFAPNYDNTATYAVGDLVTYYGKLYVCNTTITTAESWTSAHWTETNISEQLSHYTAGTGIDISNNEIAVDTSTVAMKSDLPTALTSQEIINLWDGSEGSDSEGSN